jgi:hypothetical protein
MAHLKRCWCGKTYRCERSHTPDPNVIFEDGMVVRHDDCPDFSLHGPVRGEVTYYSIESEKFVEPEEKNA